MRHNPKLKSTLYLGKHCVDVLYYYHSDHIGSSTFLTDALGRPYQFMLYLPFGEAMAQQKVAGWSTPYTFTGKEQDAATGLHYYSLSRPQDGRARYLDTRLSIWFGVDPLAEKYPEWSPYVYTLNNPIRYIDPDGRSVETDLFNTRGKKIGTDGVENGVKIVVTNATEAKQISKIKGNVDLSTVQSGVTLPSDATLQESINVLDRTVANGGLREESSIVMLDGSVVQGQTGSLPTITNGYQTATAYLPNLPSGTTSADVEATIHSHPTTVQESNGMIYPQSASTPSSTDNSTFKQYNTNIIVGPLGTINSNDVTRNSSGFLSFPSRPNGAVIYDRNSTPRIELTRKAITNILKN